MRLNKTIALVGLMGCGKSSLGRRLAERLDVPFFDSDSEIEAAASLSIPEIFERHGEPHFRDGERRVIRRLLEGPPHILATGGGAFLSPETRAILRERAFSIWLNAGLDILVERCARRDTRPLLRTGDPREILARLLRERGPVYATADITVISEQIPHNEMLKRLEKQLTAHGLTA